MIQIIVLLEIGDLDSFREFEMKAAGIMKKHHGKIISAFSPNKEVSTDDNIGEIHVLTFPDLRAFRNYQADEDLKNMKELRKKAIISTKIYVSEQFTSYE